MQKPNYKILLKQHLDELQKISHCACKVISITYAKNIDHHHHDYNAKEKQKKMIFYVCIYSLNLIFHLNWNF